MKSIIYADICIGCALCAQVAPSVYEMQGDKAVVLGEEIAEDKISEAQAALEQCPVNAIVIS